MRTSVYVNRPDEVMRQYRFAGSHCSVTFELDRWTLSRPATGHGPLRGKAEKNCVIEEGLPPP